MGLGAPVIPQSLVVETRNMSPLGGAGHGRAERWSELELPPADFILGARQVLRRSDIFTQGLRIQSVLHRTATPFLSPRTCRGWTRATHIHAVLPRC